MNARFRFFVTCPKEMEALLAQELVELGTIGVIPVRSGVYCEGDIDTAYRICLWSRLANRVLLPLASFEAASPDQLYAGTKTIEWSEHLSSDMTIAVDSHGTNANIRHSGFAAQTIKDAIVDYFREREGQRPSVQLQSPDIRINGYIDGDSAQIHLDLSGESLHQRGYRPDGALAPLKENLAAAILHRARWPELAQQDHDFVDFMCGSGTLLIEAAQMSLDIAPGLTRSHYGFLKWKRHQPELWAGLIAKAQERKAKGLLRARTIVGFDNNIDTVRIAQQNVERAQLGEVIKVEHKDVFDFRRDSSSKGLVVINPPYGRRLGHEDELPALYAAIGQVLKDNFLNWKCAVFTENQELGKHIGIHSRKIHTLYNGPVKCRLLHFDLTEDNFFRQTRLPGPVETAQLSSNADSFRNRIIKNRKRLAAWTKRETVNCYRLYDADLPEYAVAVDLYQGEQRWVHIQEYEAPKTVDQQKAQWRRREVVTILKDVLEVEDHNLFFKTRRRQRGSRQYEKLTQSNRYHEIKEGPCSLLVNFEDHLDTGLFLDHRPTRQLMRQSSSNKSFLNLFAYTGSMTVAAAMGGARTTTSVDLSKGYLDWAEKNMTLNGLAGSQHRFIRADCRAWLRAATREKYDLIFLDPPTFSNSAAMASDLDIQRDHEELLDLTMRLLEDGGSLYFSVNFRKFKLSESLRNRYAVTDITRRTIPPDFARRPTVHQCWMFKRA